MIAAGLLAHGSMPVSGLPEAFASVASMDEAHRLQLRGQLRNCAIQLDPAHRIPSWLRTTDPQNRDGQVMGSGLSRVKGKASHCDDEERRGEVRGQKCDGVAAADSCPCVSAEASRNALASETESTHSARVLRNADFSELRG